MPSTILVQDLGAVGPDDVAPLVPVGVGDFVSFKRGIEQSGKITAISGGRAIVKGLSFRPKDLWVESMIKVLSIGKPKPFSLSNTYQVEKLSSKVIDQVKKQLAKNDVAMLNTNRVVTNLIADDKSNSLNRALEDAKDKLILANKNFKDVLLRSHGIRKG